MSSLELPATDYSPSAEGEEVDESNRDSDYEDCPPSPPRRGVKRPADCSPTRSGGVGGSSKRDHHNMMERQRRSEMDQAFVDLGLSVGAPEKASRVTIVNGASIKTRAAAAYALSHHRFNEGMKKAVESLQQIQAIESNPHYSEAKKERLIKVITDSESKRLDEEPDPWQAWKDIQLEMTTEELAGFRPPPLPTGSSSMSPAELINFLELQHGQGLKFKEMKKARDLAIANGEEIAMNPEDDDDDDYCFGDLSADKNYQEDDGNTSGHSQATMKSDDFGYDPRGFPADELNRLGGFSQNGTPAEDQGDGDSSWEDMEDEEDEEDVDYVEQEVYVKQEGYDVKEEVHQDEDWYDEDEPDVDGDDVDDDDVDDGDGVDDVDDGESEEEELEDEEENDVGKSEVVVKDEVNNYMTYNDVPYIEPESINVKTEVEVKDELIDSDSQ